MPVRLLLALVLCIAAPFAHATHDGLQPRWLAASGRPNETATQALTLLGEAASHGLDAADYGAGRLAAQAAALKDGSRPADPAAAADFDRALTAGMVRYMRHLHAGRVDPRTIRYRIPSRAEEHDFDAMLHAALTSGRLRQTVTELAPALAQYQSLREALARYRALAADPWIPVLPPPATAVHPGDSYPAAAVLRRRLLALGDLPADDRAAAGDPAVYAGMLVDGVKHFQRRHGLADDGVLGRATHAALQVPLASRVRQIELALERLRWLPHLGNGPFIAINIPMFRLWARDAAAPPMDMAVIVGRALKTQTPVFTEEMTHLIFRPYWNVPRSILLGEVLPALQRDPTYLQRHDMEIVRGGADDAPVLSAAPENVALLHQGALRLRQRPGPRNSLGLVKFVFPNDASVYMHGTPAQELFGRTRRDFSHGCVRLEDPVALAAWALRDQQQWTRERIVATMQGTRSVRVDLTRPVRVILFYVTAGVMPGSNGDIHFADDIYRYDELLERALGKRPADWEREQRD
ncbi:L,D-transpeptidase family protein [Piscinibacter sp.]|uniref:L,D-transpeptidase family protein n=1 Tax=Piscinibacter sp. TaxID=1903157 RepID=UPI002D154F23|nr:L,D-transpeptidase family protein [Albitalea sp.]HUG23742.1 L,D-transpeptidase family protein [Albitalea sp.]